MKELLLIFVFLFLLTGIVHTFLNRSLKHILRMFVVAFIYFLGAYSLLTIHESLKAKKTRSQAVLFFLGFAGLVIAFFSLEALLKHMGRM